MPQPQVFDERSQRRLGCIIVWGAIIGFCALMGLAAAAYPGGTVFEPDRAGFSFLDNYWCDLTAHTARNGAANTLGAAAAKAALLILALGVIVLWSLLPSLSERASRWRWATSGAGIVSGVALIALSVGPGVWHDHLVAASGVLVVIAVVPTAADLIWRLGAVTAVFTGLAVLVGALNLITWLVAPHAPMLPTIQKLSTGVCLLWAALMARHVWVRPARSRSPNRRRTDNWTASGAPSHEQTRDSGSPGRP